MRDCSPSTCRTYTKFSGHPSHPSSAPLLLLFHLVARMLSPSRPPLSHCQPLPACFSRRSSKHCPFLCTVAIRKLVEPRMNGTAFKHITRHSNSIAAATSLNLS